MKQDKLTDFFNQNYILIFAFVFVFIPGISILAPVLMHLNLAVPAKLIYWIFRFACHQLPYRSFFLFGSQPYYPLAEANMGKNIVTFEQAIQNPEMKFAEIKAFIGNSEMGYKTALCQRDIAIYLSIALCCIVFMISKNRIPRLHWSLWIVLGLIPIAVDGFSQMLSTIVPFINRESTPMIRVLTGALFGFMTSWFLIPYLEKKIQESSSDSH